MDDGANRRFVIFAGSARRESLNRRLARHASEVAEALGVDAELLELADYPMPIYDGDHEAEHGLPENARALKRRFADSSGFLIASPEYNSSITPLLKNTLDWVSRRGDDPPDAPSPYRGKVAGLLSASPGRLGGLRALMSVRQVLTTLGVTVVPQQFAVDGAPKRLPLEGPLEDEMVRAGLERVIEAVRDTRVGPA